MSTDCPGCGCSIDRHIAIGVLDGARVAECANCGPCPKSADTPFLAALSQRIYAHASRRMSTDD